MKSNLQAVLYPAAVLLVLGIGADVAVPGAASAWPDAMRLLAGAVAMALATAVALAAGSGGRAAGRFLVSTLAIAWLAEVVGLRGGWLFGGAYRYSPDLRPVLPGGVPLFIVLSWFVLSGTSVLLLRGLDGRRFRGRIGVQSALAAWGVVAADLALDPIAAALGLWSWERPGAYFGVPPLNFLGWGAVAFAIFLLGYGWAGLGREVPRWTPLRTDLAWSASNGGLAVLLFCAADRQVGSIVPAALALAAVSPLVAYWHALLLGQIFGTRAGFRRSRGARNGASA